MRTHCHKASSSTGFITAQEAFPNQPCILCKRIYIQLSSSDLAVCRRPWSNESRTYTRGLDRLEEYGILLGFISGPALMFMNSILELWKSEQKNEVDGIPAEINARLERAAAQHNHEMSLASNQHEHEMELEKIKALNATTGSEE